MKTRAGGLPEEFDLIRARMHVLQQEIAQREAEFERCARRCDWLLAQPATQETR